MIYLQCAGLAMVVVAAIYSCGALLAVCWRRRRTTRPASLAEPVTVLKPLCGAETTLHRCLASVCAQNYPTFQIVFGVASADDPALATARRIAADHPGVDIDIVIDERTHGTNPKASNLCNMLATARHDVLVIADSDIRVGPDYLAAAVAPLSNPDVGLATCLYRAAPTRRLWSRCHAMFIDEWFAPMVLVARSIGFRSFAFGATLALRRRTLKAIGGFEALTHVLADDYVLGQAVRQQGLETVLADYVVETMVDEPTLGGMRHREIRWMRTIRSLQPISYAFSAVSMAVVPAVLGVVIGYDWPSVWVLAAVTFAARLALHHIQSRGAMRRMPWLVPLRDLLLCHVWLTGFINRPVHWRGRRYRLSGDGRLKPTAPGGTKARE